MSRLSVGRHSTQNFNFKSPKKLRDTSMTNLTGIKNLNLAENSSQEAESDVLLQDQTPLNIQNISVAENLLLDHMELKKKKLKEKKKVTRIQ